MKDLVPKKAFEYVKEHHRMKRWHKVVTCMAAAVVFITTYALILPAITMENQAFCGYEEHVHSVDDGCYEQKLICQKAEVDGHVHGDECYKLELICDKQEHKHSAGCYSEPADNEDIANSEDTQTEASTSLKKGPLKAPGNNVTQLDVTKTWSDGNDKHNADSVTIYLTANGQRTGQTVTLNAANNWKSSFTNLQASDSNGKLITYSAEEGAVSGYTSSKTETPNGQNTSSSEGWIAASNLTPNNTQYVIYYENNGKSYVLRELNGEIQPMEVTVNDNGMITTNLDNNNKWIINNNNIISVSRTNCPLKFKQNGWKFACDYNDGINATIGMSNCEGWILADAGWNTWRYMKNSNEVTDQNNATIYHLYELSTSQIVTYTPGKVDFTNTPEGQETPTVDPNAPAVGRVVGRQVNTLTEGQWYILYNYSNDSNWQGIALNANNPSDTGTVLTQSSDNGGTVEYNGSADVVWQYTKNGFRNRNGQYLTLQYDPTGSKADLNYIDSMNGAIGLSSDITHAGVTYDQQSKGLFNEEDVTRRTVLMPWLSTAEHVYNYVHFNGARNPGCRTYLSQTGNAQRGGDTPTYIAQVTYSDNPNFGGGGSGVLDSKHPMGVITGDIAQQGITLYNIDGSDGTPKPLAGVTYTITDANGKVRRISTIDDFGLNLGNLPDGKYTVSQSSVPDGYVVYPQTKEFNVVGGKPDQSLLFYDYKADENGYYSDKTAQVKDYENRIYEIQINAQSGKYTYDMGNKTFNLVVDQSNSMLFPSNVKQVAEARIHADSASNTHWNIDHAGLDKNKVYYVITDKNNSATQWALWFNKSKNCWYYQDASYYAKAQKAGGNGNNTNISKVNNQPYNVSFADECTGETTRKSDGSYYYGPHPDDNASNGYCAYCHGGRADLPGIFNSVKTSSQGDVYPIYTATSQYNRLHYLQEAMIMLVNQLGSLNQNTKVNLITFDGQVESCLETTVDSNGVARLVEAVNNIKTEGGTRQDQALQHVNGTYGGASSANHQKVHTSESKNDNYVILITDGAPVSNDKKNVSNEQVFQNLRNAANTTRQRATLISVGLSMKDVDGGKAVLKEIASDNGSGIDGKWFYAPDDSSELADILIEKILGTINTKETTTTASTVKDYISDTFYPVDEDGNPLKEGDEIHMDGTLCKGAEGDGWKWPHPDWTGPNGVLHKDDIGWYVEWKNAILQPVGAANQWYAKLNVKAKEDFIGGNAIDTNKSATITLQSDDNGPKQGDTPIELSTPNVNVHLLPMFSYSAEAIVFLGDKITEDKDGDGVPDVAEQLWSHVEFQKLINSPVEDASGNETTYNKSGAKEEDGVKPETFNLKYAIDDLTPELWQQLEDDLKNNGPGVKIDYTYDDDSSHGAVGYFTIKLEERKHNGDWDVDHPTVGDENVGHHTYIDDLLITYTPYELGQKDSKGNERPTNKHNFGNGPGTEVKETLKESEDEEYDIDVIDGRIVVDKNIDETLKSDVEQSYIFELYRLPENQLPEGEELDLTNAIKLDQQVTVTIPAGQLKSNSTAEFKHLPRGVYVVKEVAGDGYSVHDQTVVKDGNDPTNSDYRTIGDTLVFHIGYDENDEDLIEWLDEPEIDETNHHIIYSKLKPAFTVDVNNPQSYHGLSVGHGTIVNTITVEDAEIPVEKRWNPSNGDHSKETVYFVLCDKDGNPVTYEEGAHVVALNNKNDWKASFTVQLKYGEKLEDKGYTIREVSNATRKATDKYTKAAVVNDNNSELYFEVAAEEGSTVLVDNTGYIVRYSVDGNTQVATNYECYSLPETGGTGTSGYILGGLTLMLGSLIYVYLMRHRREGRVK